MSPQTLFGGHNEQRMNIYMIENKSYFDKPHKESNPIGLQTKNT